MNFPKRKVAVVGPGALGCLFAAHLKAAGNATWLIDKRPDRAGLITRQGIIVERDGQAETIPVRATTDPVEAGIVDLIIFCVKAYDTGEAARQALPLAGSSTQALSVQNGVGNVEALVEVFGKERTLGGTTAQGANLVGPGHVRHAGRGETVIGQPGGGTDRAALAADVLSASGIESRVTGDLDSVIWSKLLINASINALTAILRVRNGKLAEVEPARELMAAVARETAAVASARGVKLLYDDPVARVEAVCRATAQNISSMHQDVRNQRRTEINEINGAVAAEAEKFSIPAPLNFMLKGLIRSIEHVYNERVV